MGFPKQDYWSELFPPPADLPNPGIKPASPVSLALAGGFFATEPPEKPTYINICMYVCMYGASCSSVGKESACHAGIRLQYRRPGFDSWVQKIPLEKETAIHYSIFAWKIPWTEEPGGLQSMGSQESNMT